MSLTGHRSTADIASVAKILARWDPIGVIPTQIEQGLVPTEYDNYAPHILGMLQQGCTLEELSAHLAKCRTGAMELTADPEADGRFAGEILSWWKGARR